MSQERGSSQIGRSGPVGHPHAINIITVSEEQPTGQRVGDLWIQLPPGTGPQKAIYKRIQEDSGGDDADNA